MTRYAWFSSKVVTERSIFMNVYQVCFTSNVRKIKCKCEILDGAEITYV
jgi:hypothetical protein